MRCINDGARKIATAIVPEHEFPYVWWYESFNASEIAHFKLAGSNIHLQRMHNSNRLILSCIGERYNTHDVAREVFLR